jgi:hypothetical protein
MAVFLNLRNFARLPFCYFSFSFLLSLSSSHPQNTSLHHHHKHNQLQLLPSPHHAVFYSHHRNLHTTPNPLTTMHMYGYPQFPQATAPVEQYSAEEQFAFPNYALPSLQQMVQSSAPVPGWGSHYQGEQYALPQAAPAAWNTEQAVQSSAPVPSGDFYHQGGQFALPQAAPVAWSTEQVVQPTASVPRGNYGYQAGQYAPLPTTPGARRTIRRSSTRTPGMIRRTPSAISPAGIPSAAVPWHGTAPPMPAPQVHHQVVHQPQQRPARRPAPTALLNGHIHDHPELTDWQDQIVLHTLCEYSNGKGRHGESCANVGPPATEKAIRVYRSGNARGAKESFHRQASKNLNQAVNRERRRQELAAEAAAAAAMRSP